jgi:hypothetical protein
VNTKSHKIDPHKIILLIMMYFALVAAVLAVFVPSVTAQDVVFTGRFFPFLSFHEASLTAGQSCTDSEWTRIRDTLKNATTPRPPRVVRQRALLRSSPPQQEESRRRLNKNCDGPYAAWGGIGCKGGQGRRRNLQSAADLAMCAADYVKWNTTISTVLVPTVSTSCQALLLNAPRTMSCLPETECDIMYLNLWSAMTNAIVPGYEKLNKTGTSFCKSQRVTFGASTNFDLGHVVFHAVGLAPLTYDVDRTDAKAPFYLHQNYGTDVRGTNFDVGNYTLSVWSDRALTNHTIRFESRPC